MKSVRLRFIPAHAGNTGGLTAAHRTLPVHPRACGEHSPARCPTRMSAGSSPRMRGTPDPRGHVGLRQRFIPAYAGNTNRGTSVEAIRTVHPRACGEHTEGASRPPPHSGSSPRMRGTLMKAGPTIQDGRFIPAHAGNTEGSIPFLVFLTVHPRACGEHDLRDVAFSTCAGSSPRMRGTLCGRARPACKFRFIPAHAGNTSEQAKRSDRPAVHPRACGEHGRGCGVRISASGSSPRMRGTRPCRDERPPMVRFIPAHAGNTASADSFEVSAAVHPRACGEHIVKACADSARIGSSPRMRGTRHDGGEAEKCGRFIPAHAGNTRTRR